MMALRCYCPSGLLTEGHKLRSDMYFSIVPADTDYTFTGTHIYPIIQMP
jgi:hypothetical protein